MAPEWVTETLRVSLFSSAAVKVSDGDWQAITGREEAENRQVIPGGRVLSGPFQDGQLNFGGIGNRIDLVLSAVLPVDGQSLPGIGPWEACRDKFVSFTSSWIQKTEIPIIRLAFGAVILSRADSTRDSHVLLSELLSSVTVDPDEMRELLFRVNWPTRSNVIKDLLVNRITNWSALQILYRALQIGEAPAMGRSPAIHAVRLEIDHNTDAERPDPFDTASIIPIYSELVELASQNAAKGERP